MRQAHLRRAGAAVTTAAVAAAIALPFAAPAAAAGTAAGFTPGVALLNNSGSTPGAAEPSIQVDSHGNVYASGPEGVPNGGCPFWWIHPNTTNAQGHIWDYQGTFDVDHESAGGGDCDIATQKSLGNANFDEVSASSLSLANLTTNTTTDGGKTWKDPANPAGQQVFGNDRQWQATDQGLGVQYLTVHDLATTNIQVAVSTDGGYTYTSNGPAIDAAHQGTATGNNGNHFSTTVVDQKTHKLYIAFIAPGSPSESSEHVVYVAEGTPNAANPQLPISWTDYTVYTGPASASFSNDFPGIAIDDAGRVYIAWTDMVNGIQMSHMSTAGDASKWTAPVRVDDGTAHATVFPWLVAGKDGTVDAAWYGSSLNGTGSTCPSTRPGTAGDADGVNNNCYNDWVTHFAQSTDAGSTFTQSDASGVIHRGAICNQGLSCASGTRTLLDFFDMDLDPSGAANLVYASDTATPGTATIYYTRQCSGLSATTLAAVANGGCGSLEPAPAVGPNGTTDGAHVLTDPSGDATNPTGGGGTDPVDITNVGFADKGSTLDVTMTVKALSQVPPPGTADEYYYVTWKGPKGTDGKQTQYGVTVAQPSAAPAYQVGTFDPSTNQLTGTPTTITGSFDTTTNTITWHVPTSAIGDPSFVTASDPSLAAVQQPYALTILGEGSADAGGLLFTQPADRAPNAGFGPAWPSVATNGAPGTDVPEAPVAVLVPLVGLGVLGGVWFLRRRAVA